MKYKPLIKFGWACLLKCCLLWKKIDFHKNSFTFNLNSFQFDKKKKHIFKNLIILPKKRILFIRKALVLIRKACNLINKNQRISLRNWIFYYISILIEIEAFYEKTVNHVLSNILIEILIRETWCLSWTAFNLMRKKHLFKKDIYYSRKQSLS